jgi:hypothetical protein
MACWWPWKPYHHLHSLKQVPVVHLYIIFLICLSIAYCHLQSPAHFSHTVILLVTQVKKLASFVTHSSSAYSIMWNLARHLNPFFPFYTCCQYLTILLTALLGHMGMITVVSFVVSLLLVSSHQFTLHTPAQNSSINSIFIMLLPYSNTFNDSHFSY